MKQCSECQGRGEVMDMEVRQHGRYAMQWDVCSSCGGTGHTPEPVVLQARLFDEPVVIEIQPIYSGISA